MSAHNFNFAPKFPKSGVLKMSHFSTKISASLTRFSERQKLKVEECPPTITPLFTGLDFITLQTLLTDLLTSQQLLMNAINFL